MKALFLRRPSPAMVVALVALFVALGGVSYGLATGSVDSREIKNGTIRGKDMSKDSITARELKRRSLDGTDIKINRVGGNAVKEEVLEVSKLAKVPQAAQADNAANASSANTANSVGGATLRTFKLFTAGAQAPATVLDIGGLTLTAGCVADNPTLTASTAASGAQIRSYSVDVAAGGATENDVFNTAFDTTENPFNLLPDDPVGQVGTTVYRAANGTVVTAVWNTGDAAGGPTTCSVNGTAVIG